MDSPRDKNKGMRLSREGGRECLLLWEWEGGGSAYCCVYVIPDLNYEREGAAESATINSRKIIDGIDIKGKKRQHALHTQAQPHALDRGLRFPFHAPLIVCTLGRRIRG